MSDGTPCIDRLVLSVDLSAMLTRQLESAETFCDSNSPSGPEAPPMSDGKPCVDRLVLSLWIPGVQIVWVIFLFFCPCLSHYKGYKGERSGTGCYPRSSNGVSLEFCQRY